MGGLLTCVVKKGNELVNWTHLPRHMFKWRVSANAVVSLRVQ